MAAKSREPFDFPFTLTDREGPEEEWTFADYFCAGLEDAIDCLLIEGPAKNWLDPFHEAGESVDLLEVRTLLSEARGKDGGDAAILLSAKLLGPVLLEDLLEQIPEILRPADTQIRREDREALCYTLGWIASIPALSAYVEQVAPLAAKVARRQQKQHRKKRERPRSSGA